MGNPAHVPDEHQHDVPACSICNTLMTGMFRYIHNGQSKQLPKCPRCWWIDVNQLPRPAVARYNLETMLWMIDDV